MAMGENEIDTNELNVDYLIALTTIDKPLDEEMCEEWEPGCTWNAEAQFYYRDSDGEREMATACFHCLVPAIRDRVEKGQKIIVEVPA